MTTIDWRYRQDMTRIVGEASLRTGAGMADTLVALVDIVIEARQDQYLLMLSEHAAAGILPVTRNDRMWVFPRSELKAQQAACQSAVDQFFTTVKLAL